MTGDVDDAKMYADTRHLDFVPLAERVRDQRNVFRARPVYWDRAMRKKFGDAAYVIGMMVSKQYGGEHQFFPPQMA
jgi:predicted ATPase